MFIVALLYLERQNNLKMNRIEKYDSILGIYTPERISITVKQAELLLNKSNVEISSQHITEVLEGMIDDGFVKLFPKMKDGSTIEPHLRNYIITLKGETFKSEGGYAVKIKLDHDQKTYQIRRDQWLLYATWFAGFWAMCLVVVEILKHWKWIVTIEVLTLWIFLGIGIFVGIIIFLLVQEVKSKGK